MNKTELIELLEDLAIGDCHPTSDIDDHPCSVAIRALNQCFEVIKTLQGYCPRQTYASHNAPKTKVLLVETDYDPRW